MVLQKTAIVFVIFLLLGVVLEVHCKKIRNKCSNETCENASDSDIFMKAVTSAMIVRSNTQGSSVELVEVNLINNTITSLATPLTLPANAQPNSLVTGAFNQLTEASTVITSSGPSIVRYDNDAEKLVSLPILNANVTAVVEADLLGDGVYYTIGLSQLGYSNLSIAAYDDDWNQEYQIQLAVDTSYMQWSKLLVSQGTEKDADILVLLTVDFSLNWHVTTIGASHNKLVVLNTFNGTDPVFTFLPHPNSKPIDATFAQLRSDSDVKDLVVFWESNLAGGTVDIEIQTLLLQKKNQFQALNVTHAYVTPSMPDVNISVTADTVFGDTSVDQVILAVGPGGGPIFVLVLSANTEGQVQGNTRWLWNSPSDPYGVFHSVSVASLTQTNSILVIDTYYLAGTTNRNQDIFVVTLNSSSATGTLLQRQTTTAWMQGMVNAGGFVGVDVYLLKPDVYTVEKYGQLIAVLHAVPVHRELTYYLDPIASFTTSTTNTTSFKSDSTTGYVNSNTLDASINALGIKLTSQFKDETENIAESSQFGERKVTASYTVEAAKDDVIILMVNSYQVTKYPIAIGPNLEPAGELMFVKPLNSGTALRGGLRMFYNASHEVGNIISYSVFPPTDIKYLVWNESISVEIGSNNWREQIDKQQMNGSENALTFKQSTTVTAGVSFEFPFGDEGLFSGALGGGFEHSEQYANSTVNTTSSTFESTLTILLEIYRLENEYLAYAYDVRPYIYWDQFGAFHLNWQVNLPTNRVVPTKWQDVLNLPDPALTLRYNFDAYENATIQYLCLQISYTIPDPKGGIVVSTIVRNYSLKNVSNVPVSFFYRTEINPDPANTTGLVPIGNTAIPFIQAQSEEVAFVAWVPPSTNQVQVVVQIDPEGTIDDLNPDNNNGWSVYPLHLTDAIAELYDKSHKDSILNVLRKEANNPKPSKPYFKQGPKSVAEFDDIL